MAVEPVFVLLVVVTSIVAMTARRQRVPYSVALVTARLVVSGLRILDPPHLTKEPLLSISLPGLLFEAAFHVEFTEF